MSNRETELNDELLQKYHDGEVSADERARIEEALAESTEAQSVLARYSRLSELFQTVAAESEPDELSARRNWHNIEKRLKARPRSLRRRAGVWAAAAAAAVLLVFAVGTLDQAQSNELEIDSIDCTYDGFMLLPPEEDTGHTIIWINDPADSPGQ